MRLVLNLLWLILGGLHMAIAWAVIGVVMFVTIVGIPWGRACFTIAELSLWPFGRDVVDRRMLTGRSDVGTGCLGTIGNIIWFLVAGLWLAIGHLASALVCCVTIVGIPFGVQHLKLAGLSLAPIGKTIVERR